MEPTANSLYCQFNIRRERLLQSMELVWEGLVTLFILALSVESLSNEFPHCERVRQCDGDKYSLNPMVDPGKR